AFTSPGTQNFASGSVTVSATGGASGNAVTFASQTGSVCTTGGTNGEDVAFVSTGTCTIRASQAGNSNYSAASDVDASFDINAASQTIAFTSPGDQNFASGAVAVSATGGASGNAVTFASQTGSVCTTGGPNGDRKSFVR